MPSAAQQAPVILTCAQPSGLLTLGNFLGAIRHWAEMQDQFTSFFGIVDMHAITAEYVPAHLRSNSLSCLAQYLACGLDPEKSTLFIQSHVTGHAELAWILGCLTPIGDLQRMTQFKEKAARLGFKIKEGDEEELRFAHQGSRPGAMLNTGLLFYPVLMAADILLYNADRVPVGDDQRQHLELCRDLAQRFNRVYSDTFTVPVAHIAPTGSRIMSLQEPSRKMSKSDENANSTLFILDEPKLLRKKLMSAVTDSDGEIRRSPDKPGVTNLLEILGSLTGRSTGDLEAAFTGKGYAALKSEAADAVIATLEPVQDRYRELMADKGHLEQILRQGAAKAQARANRTLSKVYRKVGYYQTTN
ncbi:MAG: tryptophan--tRNA ligase [Puniceicoccaceae bacterium]